MNLFDQGFTVDEIEADTLRTCYFVRPRGQLGTCGFYPRPWQGEFVTRRQLAKRYPGVAIRP